MADYDHLKVSNGSGDAALMHVQAPARSIGGTVITVDSVTNVPAKGIGTYGVLASSGFIDPTTKRDFKFHVGTGNTLVIDGFEPGSTDNGNAVGDVVVVKPNTPWSDMVAGFIQNATNLGTPEAVTFAAITAASATFSGNLTVTGNVAVTGTLRSTPRLSATTTSTTLTPNIDLYNVYDLTAQATGLTIANPTGTPNNGDPIIFRIKDNGTSQAITYGTAFTNISGLSTISNTTIGKWHVIAGMWNSAVSKYQIISITTEA